MAWLYLSKIFKFSSHTSMLESPNQSQDEKDLQSNIFAQSKSIFNLSNIFQDTFNEKENNHGLELSTKNTTEAFPKSLSEKSLEEFDCSELKIFLRDIKAERENLYSLIQEQKVEIDHLNKIEALDIFFKSY